MKGAIDPRDPIMPLYGFVEGDVMGVVVLVRGDETIQTVAERLQAAAGVRVCPRTGGRVEHDGRILNPRATVRREGLVPLQRIDLVWSTAAVERGNAV